MKPIILLYLAVLIAAHPAHSETLKIGSATIDVKLEQLSQDEADLILKKLYYGRYIFTNPEMEKLATGGLRVVREDKEADFLFLRVPDGATISKSQELSRAYISWPLGDSSYHRIILSYEDLASLSEKFLIREVSLTIACP